MDEVFLNQWVARLRAEEPKAVAVLLRGSYARDQAGPNSDLDLTVLTCGMPRVRYQAVLVERPNGRLLHISVGAQSWAEWQAESATPAEWSFSLPTRQAARLLWVAASFAAVFADPTMLTPAGPPNLEDFMEAAGKMKNAFVRGDEPALRLAAQDLARWAPSLLRLLNPTVVVSHRAAALCAILDFPMAPDCYREDMHACLGISEVVITTEELHQRALRLALGIIDLLTPHTQALADQLEPDLPRYLSNGALRRYLLQE